VPRGGLPHLCDFNDLGKVGGLLFPVGLLGFLANPPTGSESNRNPRARAPFRAYQPDAAVIFEVTAGEIIIHNVLFTDAKATYAGRAYLFFGCRFEVVTGAGRYNSPRAK
jgi:hypothetical protein